MGCNSSKNTSSPVPDTGKTLLTGSSSTATKTATKGQALEPATATLEHNSTTEIATQTVVQVADPIVETAFAEVPCYSLSSSSVSLREQEEKQECAVGQSAVASVQIAAEDDMRDVGGSGEGEGAQMLPGQTTSMVLKRPKDWQEEGILFPHEGIRFLMEELTEAVRVMDPKAAWKWANLATWYQEYFYDVVHHHHDSEEAIYFPWLQARVALPAKISEEHRELCDAMDEIRDIIAAGVAAPLRERTLRHSQLRDSVAEFVEEMGAHLAEEERVLPGLLREAGFSQVEEAPVVGQIIQSLGLAGNRKALPPMLSALARWAGDEKAQAFVEEKLPQPIQLLYKYCWLPDFQQRHLGLVASLAEGVDTDPFASKLLCGMC